VEWGKEQDEHDRRRGEGVDAATSVDNMSPHLVAMPTTLPSRITTGPPLCPLRTAAVVRYAATV
jgi:hypothetical protein